MSGPIRSVIGPARKRLIDYIASSHSSSPTIEALKSTEDNLKALYDIRCNLVNDTGKIQRVITLLQKKDSEWTVYIQTLHGADRKEEEGIYEDWASSEDGFITAILDANEKLAQLQTFLGEVDSKMAELKGSLISSDLPYSTQQLPARQASRSGSLSVNNLLNSRSASPVTPAPQPDVTNQPISSVATHVDPDNFITGQPQPLYVNPPPVQTVGVAGVKLPKLELKKFNGDPTKFPEFWDSFEPSVHLQLIPDVTKFNYLKSCLAGSAAAALNGLAVTNANYREAISILQSRFGRLDIIKDSLYTKLAGLRIASGKVMDLRVSYDAMEQILRQLDALKEDINQSSLLRQLLCKLPEDVLTEMERIKSPSTAWNVNLFRTALSDLLVRKENISRLTKSNTNFASNRSVQPKPMHNKDKFSNNSPSGSLIAGVLQKKPSYNDRKPHLAKGSETNLQAKRASRGCIFCEGSHYDEKCQKFATNSARKNRLVEKKRCFICFRSDHTSPDCTSNLSCVHCKKRALHNRALCPERQKKETIVSQATEDDSDFANPKKVTTVGYMKSDENGKDFSHSTVLLLTAKALVVNPKDEEISAVANIFLDCGSQRSFITKKLADFLQLDSFGSEALLLNTFAARKAQHALSENVQFNLMMRNGQNLPIQANSLSYLTAQLRKESISTADLSVLQKFPDCYFADSIPFTAQSFEPNVVLGLDYFWDIIDNSKVTKLPSGLFMIPSKFGILVGGRQTFSADTGMHLTQVYTAIDSETNADQSEVDLETFWKLESIGIHDSVYDKDDDRALEKFNSSVQFYNGRYQIQWPWKEDHPDLPDNFGLALGRLKSLAKRLANDPELLEKYGAIIADQLSKGIVEKVDDDDFVENGFLKHYLPHHPVITPEKATTKVRLVYDASAKSNQKSNSLNDCIFKDPVMLPDLCGLLIRFQNFPNALLADIEKAFLQIGLQPEARDVTRFLWFRDPSNTQIEGNLQIYRFCRVPFGVNASPFLLAAVIKYHLQQTNSSTAQLIASNIYVDNVILGFNTVDEGLLLYNEGKQIFKNALMNLREWTTNSAAVLKEIPEHDQAKSSQVKVLGIKWNLSDDTLHISGPRTGADATTKRTILKSVASIFDPLGLVTPVTFHGKVFLQLLWNESLNWDDTLPDDLVTKWLNIFFTLQGLSDMFIPRHMELMDLVITSQLHCFVDASAKVYAAVVYLRMETSSGIFTRIIFAKSRLAPKKPVTLPRLELMAVVIGVRVTNFVQKELQLDNANCFVWSDSECVLHWLMTAKLLSVFVVNRLKEIRASNQITFSHVPTDQNPADCATRGLTASGLQVHHLWWEGPEWLRESKECWPTGNLPDVTPSVLEQVQTEVKLQQTFYEATLNQNMTIDCLTSTTTDPAVKPDVGLCFIDATRFSSLNRLFRITIFVLRFLLCFLWKKLPIKSQTNHPWLNHLLTNIQATGPITAKEIATARFLWDYVTQKQYFQDIFSSLATTHPHQLVSKLGLKLDKYGLLRCHGRLLFAGISESSKFPKLLPKQCHYTLLNITDVRQTLFHAGIQHTLAQIRQSYWILQGRSAVRNLLAKCVVCRKQQGGPYARPSMPPLPEIRVQKGHAFQFIGLDYLGPVFVKIGGEKCKAWICLFTCTLVRAIHLELTHGLSAKEFLNCLRRFIARRGSPEIIISDNAPQFKLTSQALQRAWKQIFWSEEVMGYLAKKQIQWKFIVEYAPWMGGFYERLVGNVKRSLKKSIGCRLFELDQFNTCLSEVEAVVNSRPLTYVYDDAKSQTVLSPRDFLCVKAPIGTPMLEEDHNDEAWTPKLEAPDQLVNFWRKSQKALDLFWNFWSNEYLTSLRERTQTDHKGPHIRAKERSPIKDEVVLVKEENMVRGAWKLARITELIKSQDGQVRAAKIMLPNHHILTRPLNLLYPLEASGVAKAEYNQLKTMANSVKTNHKVGPHFSTTMLCFVVLLLIHGAVANKCSADNGAMKRIASPKCVENGYVIFRLQNSELCWKKITCPDGNHLNGEGTCIPKCACPSWTNQCSHHDGPEPPTIGEKNAILEFEKPDFCSLTPNPNCNSEPTHFKAMQIETYDGKKHLVKKLQLSFDEVAQDEFACIGDGKQTGTPAFCENFPCEPSATKICFYFQHEIVYFESDDGKIPIRAWGSVPIKFYGPKSVPAENPVCSECSLRCVQGGIEILTNENIEGCAEVTTLTAERSVCTIQNDSHMNCIITEATRLSLVPQGQDTCLLIKDPMGEPLGTMSIEVQDINLACQVKTEYFTRSFHMNVEAVKRCSGAGSCTSGKCEKVNIHTKIEELNGQPNESPGFTYCAESCGCASCGCFYCTYACLFYRTFSVPTSDRVYEVFTCPLWKFEVTTVVRLQIQGESYHHQLELHPGIPIQWKNMKMTLVSLSNPVSPILSSEFLTDGQKTVIVKASAKGQPVAGTVGELQCGNREKARHFDCYFPHDTCSCSPTGRKVHCSCTEMNLESLFVKPEYLLPMKMAGFSIYGTGNQIKARYNGIASMELQLLLEGMRLSSKIKKNTCKIRPLSFGGCYGCYTGAKLEFECHTDFGEALAHVACGKGSFSTICGPTGTKAIATMNFDKAVIKEDCIVSCPAGSTKFSLSATLVFVNTERLGNINSLIAGKHENGKIDFGIFANFFSGNLVSTILAVLVSIGLFIATIFLLPILLKFTVNKLCNIWQNWDTYGPRKGNRKTV